MKPTKSTTKKAQKASVSERGFPLRGDVKKSTRTKLAELVTYHALRFLKERKQWRSPDFDAFGSPSLYDYNWEEEKEKVEKENACKERALKAIIDLKIRDSEKQGGMGRDAITSLHVILNLMGAKRTNTAENLYRHLFSPYMSAMLKTEEQESPALFKEMWTKDLIPEPFAEGGTDISYYGQIESIIFHGNIELAERCKGNPEFFIDPKTKETFHIHAY